MPHHFIFTTSPKQFESITQELIYIDMQELSSENAYNTMKKVCQTIGLRPPSSNEIFSKKIADSLALNIEKDFVFPKNEVISDDIFIKILPYENTLHKNFTFLIEKFSSPHLEKKLISICLIGKNKTNIRKKLLKNKDYMNIIIEKIDNYLKYIGKIFIKYEELKLNEDDILIYFQKDPEMYYQFSKLLDYEVSNVERVAPQILKNWIYYAKFLNLKNTHDNTNSRIKDR
ncbi:hypothetical protein BJI48_01050 [Helicobacter sp. 11S02596-1]|nr:hypothetical protein BJI48_01050 [Helicobacter sp. 11S02596-1]